MSTRVRLLGAALCLTSAGCLTGRPSAGDGFLHLFVRNTVEAPCQAVDDQCFKLRSWLRACDAWADYTGNCRSNRYSWDFREGFEEGYVDYLDAGGTGNPPAAPPARYWQTKYQDPAGVQAIRDWFAGFRQGSEAARASGYRDSILVPLSSLPGNETVVVPESTAPAAPALETSPAPRRDMGGDAKPDSTPNR